MGIVGEVLPSTAVSRYPSVLNVLLPIMGCLGNVMVYAVKVRPVGVEFFPSGGAHQPIGTKRDIEMIFLMS